MARLLHDEGYTNVRPLLGGFDAWVSLGYPVERHVDPQLGPVSSTSNEPSA
jgi:3-mercaptopyruvate sulfurtransferase SseA